MTNDVTIINERIDHLFLRRHNVRYWIQVTYDHIDGTFNFFFNSNPKEHRPKSVPLHTLQTTSLERLEQVIKGIKAHTSLPIEYYGFKPGDLWPSTGRPIQYKQRDIETPEGEPF
ncbi:acetyl-CoA carboxylase [Lacticaseibacillus salsurivasis]|uniref:acetyl-CoA carboxylase n=1 Tax=Lacticaseibacillus salsurivasis TaxID=3081441 RepID=UPI0030C727E5